MKVEVGKIYRDTNTGDTCIVKELLIFNTCVMIEQDGKEYYCRYKDFIKHYEES